MTRTRVQQNGIQSGAVVLPTDSRLTDARTPTAHKTSHATGGTDAITPADIGAAAASHTHTLSQITDAGTSASRAVPASGNATSTQVVLGSDTRLTDSRTPTSHTHGNITNAGAIGSTANLPVITTTSGVLTTGTFGTAANTFCQGNDSRLSDSRTPTSHTHGNVTNAGAIGSTANLPVITTTSGVLTTGTFGTAANSFCQGNDSRLSDARTPTAHAQAASTISDSTAAGRALLTAADAAAQRTAIGIGTADLQIPLGSATSPGLDFTGDPNTGIFSTAGDHISISTGGVERMRIDSNGAMYSTPPTYSSLAFHGGCRHWVNFQGTANTNLTGTYSQSGTTLTVTATAHGLLVGQRVYLDFTSGSPSVPTDGAVDVATVANANTFTCTLGASATTSGNVTLTRPTVRNGLGVSSVADLGVGLFAVNLSPSAPHANYAVIGSGSEKPGTAVGIHVGPTASGLTTERVIVAAVTMADALVDCDVVSVAIFY